jgi:coenzyme F420-dependent glucose-6-phosphate dehydrogenase
MTRYFLGCGHEMFHPRDLLDQAVAGERAGFDGIACSDHLQPWWEPGQSGHAWMWLGAAAQATERIPVGPAVTVALQRYHPVMVAQGFATLEAMFPGRVFVGIGSGESLNESPLGLDWPDGDGQLEALEEALGLIRRLWDGERVDHEGRFFRTKRAYLHTRPETPPPLYVSAFHPGAARVAGKYGDGLWTMGDPEIAPDVIEAYHEGCAEAGREPGEIVLEAMFSWAPDDEAALEQARPWKGAQPPEFFVDDWFDPQRMYVHAESEISDDEFRESAILSADPDVHVQRIRQLEKLGPTVVKLTNVSGDHALDAIRVYGEQVLPRLRAGATDLRRPRSGVNPIDSD